MRTLIFKFYLVLGLLIFATSCSDDDIPEVLEPTLNIVETAQSVDELSSLVAALQKADEGTSNNLVTTLSGDGPFTVFAPTNEAFSALLEDLDGYESLDDFSTQAEKDLLATILQYHVIAGSDVASNALVDGQVVETLQGESIAININTNIEIGDATDEEALVVLANIGATNGIVHVINKVLLPQDVVNAINNRPSLVELVVNTEDFSILEAALIKADLVETLNTQGPFTVFAPTNDAFVALLDALGDDYSSLDDFNTDDELQLLKNILLYHVIVGSTVKSTDLTEGTVETGFVDNNINVIASGDTYVLGDATETNASIIAANIFASNGIVHVINKVLVPEGVL